MIAQTPPSLRPLPVSFFRRPTLELAGGLLGRFLFVTDDSRCVGGRIVEVEAYIGEDDPACHAFRGQTPRNRIMYGPPGHAYVYFTYGNHWMLNVVAEREGYPAAVLIRALEPTHGLETMRQRRGGRDGRTLTNGPGKLTQALAITGADNGVDLRCSRLLLTGGPPSRIEVATSGRIGVGEGSDVPWRFFIKDNLWVSPYRRGTRAARQAVKRQGIRT